MADTQGFFFPDQTPEQTDLLKRQALANQLLQGGLSDQATGQYGGLANAGKSIAGALLARRLSDKATALETQREGSYSSALGNLLSPKDNSQWNASTPADASGVPGPVNVSPAVGAPLAQRVAATGNPDLQRQLAPQLLAQQLQANAPITPYQQAELAQQQRVTDPAYQAQIKALPGPVAQPKPQSVIDQELLVKAAPGPAPQLTAGKSPLAESQALDEIRAREAAAAQQASVHGWQVMQDPTNGQQFNYNPATHQATDLAGKPYTPGGAAKLVTNQARSPAAMYLQKYQAEHPQATSADLADVAATFGAQQKAVRDFATGPEGNIITRLNTAVSHLDTLQKLGMALDNGDVQGYNKLRNAFREQFGSELPTNFNAGMPIVAGEVSKAIVGTQGGTREDRAELERTLTDAASKRQLTGAVGTQKSLLQGQLSSRRKQYENATGRKDFDKFLSGETQKELGVGGEIAAPPPGNMTSAPSFKYDANGNRVNQ